MGKNRDMSLKELDGDIIESPLVPYNTNKSISELLGMQDMDDFIDITTTSEQLEQINGVTSSSQQLMKVVYMTVQGFGASQIATELGIDMIDLKKLRESEEFRLFRDMVTQEVINIGRTFLTMGTFKAVKTLLGCLDSANEKIRLDASTEILNRVGLKQPEQITLVTKGNELKSMPEEELMKIINMGKSEITPIIEAPINVIEDRGEVDEQRITGKTSKGKTRTSKKTSVEWFIHFH